MEDDIVLTDEVDELCLRVFPPFLPAAEALGLCVAELLGVGDIADWGVEPYVEDFPLCPLDRDGDASLKVACHGTWLEVHVKP